MARTVNKLALMSALLVFCSLPASADSVTYSGTNTTLGLAATLTLTTSGTNLIVTLTNTSLTAVTAPASVLTGVFFTLAGNPTLTPVSALLSGGSAVVNCTTANNCTMPVGGNVGGEWAYASGLSGAPLGANAGLSSSGLNLFGSGNFNGPDLQPPAAVDGMQFGLLSPVTTISDFNGGMLNNAFIQNQVTFTLSGLPAGFTLAGNVTNVSFQYGTALTEPNVPGTPIPEPGTLALFGTGLLGLAAMVRRRITRS